MLKRFLLMDLAALFALFLWGCAAETAKGGEAAAKDEEAIVVTGQGFDGTYQKKEGSAVIYLAVRAV